MFALGINRRSFRAVATAAVISVIAPVLLALAQPAPGELVFDVDLFLWEVGVTGPPREAVTVDLSAPDGSPLASGSGILNAQGTAQVELLSPAGDRFIPRPGDVLSAATASVTGVLELPPLEVGADLAVGDVFGKTTPEMSLTLVYDGYRWPDAAGGGPPVGRWDREADKSGRFSFGLASVMKMRHFDRFRIFLHVGPHTVARYVLTIALSVNHDRRRLVGRLEPFVDYVAEVRRGGTVVTTGTARTPYEGAIALPLTDSLGSPFLSLPADIVSVQAAAGLGTRDIQLEVPDLALDLATDSPTATGRAPVDGDVLLQWRPSALGPRTAQNAQVQAPREADGSFRVTWPGLSAFSPGSQVHMIYVFPDGNFVNFTRALSLVKVEAGGSYACGIGNAFEAVDMRLADGSGQPLAMAKGVVGELGGQPAANPYTSFVTRFTTPSGSPVAAESGQAMTARVGTSEITAVVGALEVKADWAAQRATARYRPAAGGDPTEMRYFDIAGPCLLDRASGGGVTASQELAKAGDWYGGVLRASAPRQGFPVVATDPQGFKVSGQARRAQAQIYIGTNRVGGLASPHAPVTVTLRPASGASSTASAVAEMDTGIFSVSLGSPAAVMSRVGDVVQLASPEEVQSVTVEPLDAFFSIDFGVYGHAPPTRTVRVSLFTELGETTFTTTSDADGGYSLFPWDLAARLRRDMEAVRKMRVVLPTANGHEIVVEERLNPTRIYLPTAVMRAVR